MPDPTPEQDFAEVVAAVGRGDRPRALQLADEAFARGLDHPLILLLVAERREEEGRADEALGLLASAAEVAPDAAEIWRRSGRLLARQGRLAEGLTALQRALSLEPDVYPALIDAGAASFKLADLGAADAYYRRAAELSPAAAEPLAALAAVAARRENFVAARDLAQRALSRDPALVTAHMAIARSEVQDGEPALAEARLSALMARPELADDVRVGVLDLRAEALDALDRAPEAFADYVARNALLDRINAPRMRVEVKERRVERARRVAGYLASAPDGPWGAPAGRDTKRPPRVETHVFLLGFPRSGTTLLEKALAGHPDVVTLEEIDHLEAAAGHLLDDAAALDRLARLSPAEAGTCRLTYWRAVAESLGGQIDARIVVDKLPLHTANLPLIAKLFPDARILFALRDPRDVVFSCFRRTFRVNAAMYEFLTLEGAARYYDAVMTLADLCRAKLPLRLHEVRHEQVVADFDGEVGEVLAFIGADWHPGVRGFAERARAALKTPSDPQVARGLNAKGLGQWRRQEQQLKPVLDVLAPWVSRFGYPAG